MLACIYTSSLSYYPTVTLCLYRPIFCLLIPAKHTHILLLHTSLPLTLVLRIRPSHLFDIHRSIVCALRILLFPKVAELHSHLIPNPLLRILVSASFRALFSYPSIRLPSPFSFPSVVLLSSRFSHMCFIAHLLLGYLLVAPIIALVFASI